MYFDCEKDRPLGKNVVVRTVFPPNSYTEVLTPVHKGYATVSREGPLEVIKFK